MTDHTNWPDEMVREWPFPFRHVVTFASDVDAQPPWLGVAIHRKINEEVGLPIAGSLWVQSGRADWADYVSLPRRIARMARRLCERWIPSLRPLTQPSSLFTLDHEVNDAPSWVDGHTVFSTLVREWHRGNIDHLHSWQDDLVPRLVQDVRGDSSIEQSIAPPPPELENVGYSRLRLVFDQEPSDFSCRLVDQHGNELNTIRSDHWIADREGSDEFGFELPIHSIEETTLKLVRLTSLQITELRPGNARLLRIERDTFGRGTVSLQAPTLRAWKIRPLCLTSHGGVTLAQAFSPEGYEQERPEWKDHAFVQSKITGRADDPSSHAYHADILRDLGVDHVWGYGESTVFWHQRASGGQRLSDGIYQLERTSIGYDGSSEESFVNTISSQVPEVTASDLRPFYCEGNCEADQGVVAGLLAKISLARARLGTPVEDVWYTHLGSGGQDWQRTPSEPLKPTVIDEFHTLARHYYGYGCTREPRVWVPPVGLLARYRSVRNQLEQHVRVDSNAIEIESWIDPVTGRRTPHPGSATRDLHGTTIYVESATEATLVVDGMPIDSFTRNPADQTGRESITVVDDSTPTPILGRVPIATSCIHVEAEGCEFTHDSESLSICSLGDSQCELSMRPRNMASWNTSHIQLRVRVGSSGDTGPEFCIILEFPSGEVSISSSGYKGAPQNASKWQLDLPDKSTWTDHIFATTDLDWPQNQEAPPRPLGRVRRIRVLMRHAERGDTVDISRLRTLRPNTTADPADATLIAAGQLRHRNGRPLVAAPVWLKHRDETRITRTDLRGYFRFDDIRRGAIVSIWHQEPRTGRCFHPQAGVALELLKHEVELDIEV